VVSPGHALLRRIMLYHVNVERTSMFDWFFLLIKAWKNLYRHVYNVSLFYCINVINYKFKENFLIQYVQM
jgi:hypothetical protein